MSGCRPHHRLITSAGRTCRQAARDLILDVTDRIDCGPGKDKAFVDKRRDRTRRCEKVKQR